MLVLAILGNEVKTAHDGLQAIEVARQFQPDIVLLDIGLPKLDGYEVARGIRSERGNNVLLIALTGWGKEDDRRRSMEAGFDHHFTKPVEFNQLREVLAGSLPPATD